MDYEIEQLSEMDVFFFYGEPGSDVDMETQSDIVSGLMQEKRSLYFDRRNSAGVTEKENMPNSVSTAIFLRYDVTNWISYRNSQVGDGLNGTKERRVVCSQNTVLISKNNKGEINLNVYYIPFINISQPKNVVLPINV
jgi:hypothetical protein